MTPFTRALPKPGLLCLLVALALAGGRTSAHADPTKLMADTGTAKIDFAAREWLDVGLDVNGVKVDRLQMRRPGKVTGLFTRHDEPNRGRIVITNGTDRKVMPAVAVAVFDGGGHLLAAANTGLRTKAVDPGETVEMELHFGGVFRHLDDGATLYVSLEY